MMIMIDEKTNRPNGYAVTGSSMSCEEFQDQLPELMNSDVDIHEHEHLKTCHRCTALLADLEAIAQAAQDWLQATHEPKDDGWKKLEKLLTNENRAEPDDATMPGQPA